MRFDISLGYFDIMERKLWRNLVKPGVCFHLARFRFWPNRRTRIHTHDFPEIFWIESGRARHLINGCDKRLDPGDLIFVRAPDQHVLAPVDNDGFMLVNLAFAPVVLADLLKRHREDLLPFHNGTPPLPVRVCLSKPQLKSLMYEVGLLARSSRQRLALEKFLLELYTTLLPGLDTESAPMPDWLAVACDRIQSISYFSEGAAGLVRAAKRSPEHVARVVRARFGCTPSAYVNRVRMAHAARELSLTSKPIVDLALECGIADLSHFYALFRSAFGQTPRRYRLCHQLQLARDRA